MQDLIRESLKNAYKDQKLSERKKEEILTNIRYKHNKKWMPFIATIIVTCCVLLITFSLLRNTEVEVSLDSIQAPNSVEIAYMERWHEFLMIANSEEKEQATIQYLAKSDWLLQRAIEGGHSIFFSSPTLTANEKLALNELLHYMYLWVKEPNVVLEIPEVRTFNELTEHAPKLVETIRESYNDRYMSTSEEKQKPKLQIFYEQPIKIISILVFLSVFVFLLYNNWKGNRKYFLAAIQISVICLVFFAMFLPKSGKYAFDETTLLQQSIPTFDEPTIVPEKATFSYAATFGDERYVLVDLGNGINGLARFSKNDRGYAWSSSEWGRQLIFQNFSANSRVIAVQERHGVSRIDIVESNTKRQVSLSLNPNEAGIYLIDIPEQFRSYEVRYFTEKGERMH